MGPVIFPEGFVFGAATSAYQIEGATREDGRGESIWDRFARGRGRIRGGGTGDLACDHYHRYREDVALMRELGLQAYRFSVAWPRVQPEGEGTVNQRGLDFYDRLVDELLASGIAPTPTLFHWDLPQALQDRYRGFRSRAVAERFADYAEAVARRLGDRVRRWITVNEPFEFAAFGHLLGTHAPGVKSPFAYFEVVHNLLRAHALGMERLRGVAPSAEVGITVSLTPVHPATPSPRDRAAARLANQLMNDVTLAPLLRGRYPEELWRAASFLRPKVREGDLELIARPVDFVGINNYQREFASYRWWVPLFHLDVSGKEVAETEFVRDGVQHTSMGWEVYPDGLHECLMLLKREYGNPPVWVTENGAAFDDVVSPDGAVHDPLRVRYLESYLARARQAVEEGANLRGYFVWSLLDNFEWAVGYTKRFGIVRVDYRTQARTVKDSGRWLRDCIRANAGRAAAGEEGR